MDNDLMAQIKQRLAELPEDVRAAIQSSDLDDKVRLMGQKYTLHIDQVGELQDEVMLAMLGLAPLEELPKRLTDSLHVPAEQGAAIAAQVSTEIFAPIRESLQKFMSAREKKAVPAPPAPPPPDLTPGLAHADVVLTQKTVSYKTDPYREPV